MLKRCDPFRAVSLPSMLVSRRVTRGAKFEGVAQCMQTQTPEQNDRGANISCWIDGF